MTLDQRFAEAMGALLGPDFPSEIGLAVSGGGDSMAMLTLAHNWTRVWGLGLRVVTVDHGLRPEAGAEAALVAEECAALGWPHATVRWRWDGRGNVMDAARQGRLEAIDRWRGGLRHVLMAHTRDDVAETFVMRLARGSGVEGLSAMAAARCVWTAGAPALTPQACDGDLPPCAETPTDGGYCILRPCLGMTRAELRHYLRTLKGRWVEDPTNDDPRFDRVRVRQAREALDALGLDAATLAATAQRMGRAREALEARALQVWTEIGAEGRVGGTPTGELLFDRNGFEAVEADTRLRLLAAALRWVSGADYRPRAEPLEALAERLMSGGGGTLSGCEARMERDVLRVFREYDAVADLSLPLGDGTGLWDGRWRVRGAAGNRVRALGEDGWAQVPHRPEGAPPFRSARALPSLWYGQTLLACPGLGYGAGLDLALVPMGQGRAGFAAFLLTH